MDPNEALKAIRELIAELHSGRLLADEPSSLAENLDAHLEALASNVEALDEWLSKGGFAPADWAGVQQLNTAAVGPTDRGPCTGTVRINTKTLPCELDAPHPGWAHFHADSRRTVAWCSDAEALDVVVE